MDKNPDVLAPVNEAAERLVAFGVLGVLAVLLLPLPPIALDLLLALNIAVAVLILLVALRLRRPLDFSVFPSLLLITTLFRLGLNVATTRLILTQGSSGIHAAGEVIATFGEFAAGGSLVVGAVVFLILLVVNFTVITKGSTRISEVAARFALDAMPGKQMAIDADLASGAINDQEARRRRATLEQEAEFFGAMDGASKFVRGDAVAGLIIVGINIVGGLLAGVARDQLSLAQAGATYTILTMGDGLVTQIPALLVSTAAGMVVTRAGDRQALGSQVNTQVLAQKAVLQAAAVVMVALGLLPGMPLLAFGALAVGALLLAGRAERAARPVKVKAAEGAAATQEDRMPDLLHLEALEVQVGASLLPLIDLDRGGELPGRITSLRKQVAQDLGVVLPPVHLRDNLGMDGQAYRVMLRGVELGQGSLYLDRVMALDGSGQAPSIPGIAAKEPAFGLPCVWITPAQRPDAEARGLTLVDPASVITTHLSELVRRHAHELMGRQEVQELLNLTGKSAPKLVESTIPAMLTLTELVAVTRGLLREGVSVRDLRTVLEAVADAAVKSKEPSHLLEAARRRLSRTITARVADDQRVVHALSLARRTEDVLRSTLVHQDGEAALAPDVDTARRVVAQLERHASVMAGDGHLTVVLAPPDLRRPLFDLLSRFVPDISVINARELATGASLRVVGTLDVDAAA